MTSHISEVDAEIIEHLKSSVLDLEWEISDKSLNEFSTNIEKLRVAWSDERVLLIYLQILSALGQYVKAARDRSHPSSIRLLTDVFQGLEEALKATDLSEKDKTAAVSKFVQRYNELKTEIAKSANEQEEDNSSQEIDGQDKSKINTLMKDKEESATDSIFDSMLDEMVKADTNDKPVKKSPPPPVQAAFNKNDGTVIDPDRNVDEKFAEADELLDDFFDDDDEEPSSKIDNVTDNDNDDDAIDLSVLDQDEVLDLSADDDMETESEEKNRQELSSEDVPANDDLSAPEQEDFPEVDSALDDFFAEDDEIAEPASVAPGLEDTSPDHQDEVVAGDIEPDLDQAPREDFVPTDDVAGVEELELEPDEGEPQGMATGDLGSDDEVEIGIVTDEEEAIYDVDQASSAPDESIDEEIGVSVEPDLAKETLTEPEFDEIERKDDVDDGEVSTPGSSEKLPTEDLRLLLLSVDWEVGDKLIDSVKEQLAQLRLDFAKNTSVIVALDLLSAVLTYVEREQAQAISESMACLKLITASLEEIVADPDANNAPLSVSRAVTSFLEWHELVVVDLENRAQHVASTEDKVVDGPEVSADDTRLAAESSNEEGEDVSEKTPHEILRDDIMAEVSSLLTKEIAALREELLA